MVTWSESAWVYRLVIPMVWRMVEMWELLTDQMLAIQREMQ